MKKKFHLVDVGARGGLQYPWETVCSQMSITFFEPEPTEHDKLKLRIKNCEVLPFGLSNRIGERKLYVTKAPGCTSLYPPNTKLLKHFPEVDRFQVVATPIIKLETIDHLIENKQLHEMDFIKIDVQGAELDVLKGGEKTLSHELVGLEVEIEFLEIYEGQPLFSDVDSYIQKIIGLRLMDLRKVYWKHQICGENSPRKGVIAFGDALYLRPAESIVEWAQTKSDPEHKLKSALFTALAYNNLDYCKTVLSQPALTNFLKQDYIEFINKEIEKRENIFTFNNLFFKKISKCFYVLYRFLSEPHRGWAYSESRLGEKLVWSRWE
jgi:FkbM family methyltransferase